MDALRLFVALFTCSSVVSSRFVLYPEQWDDTDDSNANITDINYIKDKANSVDSAKGIKKHDSEINAIASEHAMKLQEDSARIKRSTGEDAVPTESELIQRCSLFVSSTSIDKFQKRVLHNGATALILHLNFSQDINITGSPEVILPYKWRWVFQDTLPYLQMPYAAVVWSLGLLSLHNGRPVTVELSYKNQKTVPQLCRNYNWTVGDNITDQIIGNAIGEMTNVVAVNDLRYNTSHWCYMRKIQLNGMEVFPAFDDNFFSTNPSLEYSCCKYTTMFETPYSVVECARRHVYDPVWWDVPMGLGILMLLYFSLIFLKVSGMIHEKILQTSIETDDVANSNAQAHNESERSDQNVADRERNDKVYLKGKSPVTSMSMLSSAISPLMPLKRSTKSRMAIFVYSLFTLLVPGIELLTYYFFLYDYVVDLAKNNISIGFSAMLIGWEANKMKFSIFCGPFVTLGIYLIIGWILMLTPKLMANQLYNGVAEGYDNSKCVLTISLEQKERLGSVKVKKHSNGYFRLFKLQMCHIYMLINPVFWIVVARIVKDRWIYFLTSLEKCLSSKIIVFAIAVPCFPFYIAVSLSEIALAIVFYAIPMLSFIFCVLRGFTLGLNKYVSENCCTRCSRFGTVLRLPVGVLVFLLLIYYLYVFTVLFFDSFFFLSRILMFTYTAVVAYPRETYGYFMLILISAYFGLEGFFRFGDIYKLILQITVKLCKHDGAFQGYLYRYKGSDDTEVYGISRDMFEYLVEQIRPRRVHALHSIIKFASMVFVLSVSIILMDRFKKFEDLSLFVHIFIILFICALPAIYNFAIAKEDIKAKIKKKVKKNLRQWIEKKTQQNGIVAIPTV